jgi:hypothetical protein
MSINQNTLRLVEQAVDAYKNADTSNTPVSLQGTFS